MGFFWHLYGTGAGAMYLFGPSAADEVTARTLAGIAGLPYLATWDHEPSQAEVDAALP